MYVYIIWYLYQSAELESQICCDMTHFFSVSFVLHVEEAEVWIVHSLNVQNI